MTTAFPLIGIHGLNDNNKTWAALRRCGLAIHGNDMPWATVQGVASDAAGIAYALDRFHRLNEEAAQAGPYGIIAHSLGAAVSLRYLASRTRNPYLRGLVLLCPAYVSKNEIARPGMHGAHRERFNQVFTQRLLLHGNPIRSDLAGHMAGVLLRAVSEEQRKHVLRMVEDASSSDLEAIQVPTLLITGGADPSLTATQQQELVSRLPHVESVAVPHWGHFCHLEDPTAVSSLIGAWAETQVPTNP